jgi:hypothetical protein
MHKYGRDVYSAIKRFLWEKTKGLYWQN